MKKNKLTYSSAISDLEKIVEEIESGEIAVDVLTEKVKKASELIKFCKDSLRNTQKEVEDALTGIETDSETEES